MFTHGELGRFVSPLPLSPLAETDNRCDIYVHVEPSELCIYASVSECRGLFLVDHVCFLIGIKGHALS
jgi:hypothetical protein